MYGNLSGFSMNWWRRKTPAKNFLRFTLLNNQGMWSDSSKSEISCCCCSVAQLCATLCNSMDCSTRLPCPSPSPRACSNSCPLSRWCHPTVSSSVAPFSSCPWSFPPSRVFSNESRSIFLWFSFSRRHQGETRYTRNYSTSDRAHQRKKFPQGTFVLCQFFSWRNVSFCFPYLLSPVAERDCKFTVADGTFLETQLCRPVDHRGTDLGKQDKTSTKFHFKGTVYNLAPGSCSSNLQAFIQYLLGKDPSLVCCRYKGRF